MRQGKTTFLKSAVIVISILIFILCVFYLPHITKNIINKNPEYAYLKYPFLAGMYATTIPFYFALYKAFKLLNLISNNKAFSESALKSLIDIKKCALTILIIYTIGLLLFVFKNALVLPIGIMGAVIIFACSIIAHSCDVLEKLLKDALKIKSENDLTI